MNEGNSPGAELAINYYTHGDGAAVAPHTWRYQGRVAQAYICIVCQLRVTKRELKEATDA